VARFLRTCHPAGAAQQPSVRRHSGASRSKVPRKSAGGGVEMFACRPQLAPSSACATAAALCTPR
jgi:hypothetical protein